jgi:hypothetical protein
MFDNTVHKHIDPDPSPSVAPHAPPSAVPTQPHASTSTSVSTSPGEKLPTTGVDAGWLVLIALVVGLTGVVLVAAAARARSTRS